MKVLAERSNAIFLWGPFAILASMLYFYLYIKYDISLSPRYYYFGFFLSLFISTVYNLIHRIALPQILIEYDKAGIYVYNRRNKEPIIIRYEHLWSSVALPGEDEFDKFDAPDTSFWGMYFPEPRETVTGYSRPNAMTGSLRIELPNQFITIHGIKNVREVSRQLDRLVDENKKNKMEFYEAQMEKRRREDELAELAKHDINT